MMRSVEFIFASAIMMYLFLSCSAYGEPWLLKFDFGPMGEGDSYGIPIAPEPGYIGVDPTMMFGEQQVNGMDYGITLYEGDSPAGASEKSSWHTRNSRTSLALDYVYFHDKRSAFEIAVPNGDYLVTVAGGNAGWDENEIRCRMEGNLYGSTNPGAINDNVYILDVCPIDRGADGYLTWTLEDKEQHDDMSGYGIETWGANNSHAGDPLPLTFQHMEIGYLQNQPVTVADGRLSISGWEFDVVKICFVEIMPYTCESITAAGHGVSGDVNLDCTVDLADLAILTSEWNQCSDPCNPDCGPVLP